MAVMKKDDIKIVPSIFGISLGSPSREDRTTMSETRGGGGKGLSWGGRKRMMELISIINCHTAF